MLDNESIRLSPYYKNRIKTIAIHDNEIFKEIPLEDCKGYAISNYGRIYNINKGIMITPFITNAGYLEAKINSNNKSVHRLEMITFKPIKDYDTLDVNHINGNKLFNKLDNLEWCTRSENIMHAFSTGLAKLGQDHPNSKYSDNIIHEICKLLELKLPYKEICSRVGLDYNHNTMNTIYKIKHKKLWKHISCKYNI